MSRGLAVGAFAFVVLAASVLLVERLRCLEEDRSAGRRTVATVLGPTATRVVYSILVVAAYVILPLAWAVGATSTAGLAPYVTAPLAMRLGDAVSHRSGPELGQAKREAVALLLAFIAIYALGLALFPDLA